MSNEVPPIKYDIEDGKLNKVCTMVGKMAITAK
jgi:hypothetical protein